MPSLHLEPKQPKANALCFRTRDDAIAYADDLNKRSRDWMSFQSRDFAERYEKLEFDIELEFASRTGSAKCKLLFLAVPDGGKDGAGPSQFPVLHGITDVPSADWDQSSVLGVCYFIHGPKKVIPSLVCFKFSEEGDDVGGQILAATFDDGLQARGVIRDREVSTFGCDFPGETGSSITSLVQSGASGLRDFVSEVGKFIGQRLSEADLEQGVPIRIGLGESGVGVLICERFNRVVQPPKLSLRTRESLPGALKGI